MRLYITVRGRPAPQGSHELGAAGQFRDSSPYLASWRQQVRIGTMREYARLGIRPEELPLFPAGTPVIIEQCTFYVTPEQCRAAGTDEPIGQPDVDKLLRATLDGLGGAKDPKKHARLFADDSQVKRIRELSKERPAIESYGAYIIIGDGRDAA